jgi:hypothetical protein
MLNFNVLNLYIFKGQMLWSQPANQRTLAKSPKEIINRMQEVDFKLFINQTNFKEMKKSLKKIALVAILAFCFQPMSISADCVIRDNESANGVCRSYTNNGGGTGYTCLQKYFFQWGSCNVGSSNQEDTIEG